MEPRFSLPDSTPRSSKTPLVISGLQIYIYGLGQLTHQDGEIAVLYLAHNRTRTYLVTEGIAHEVLHRYRNDGRKRKLDIIAVTFNMRNHGDREISPEANLTWKNGNENHGIDLLSLIDGSALDFQLVISYLPAYLTQFSKLHTIMAGVSLGGHVSWRMPALLPRNSIAAMFMVVSCPNLTALMLSRLGLDPSSLNTSFDELYKVPYGELEKVLTEQQRKRWPRTLHQLMAEGDRKVKEEWDDDVPLLLMGGKQDPLVPVRFMEPWVEKRREREESGKFEGKRKLEVLVQDNTGHSCTKEMVWKMAEWLSEIFGVYE